MRRPAWCLGVALSVFLAGVVRAEPLISLDAPEGATLFDHAGVPASGFSLLRYFVTQDNQAFCGVASSVIVLNSLGVEAPVTPTLFPYRLWNQDNFFTDKVLAIKSATMVSVRGLELEQLGAILGTFGLKVEVRHADELKNVDGFRSTASAALADSGKRVIVNYSRKALNQEGGGHISPLAAYDKDSDRFLILDVARYKVPPVWVTAKDLFDALNTKDTDAGKKRGLVIVSKN